MEISFALPALAEPNESIKFIAVHYAKAEGKGEKKYKIDEEEKQQALKMINRQSPFD